MAEHTHRTSNEPLDRLLDNPVAMTLLTLACAGGAITSIVIGFRLATAFAWGIGG
jgi:hypothetical protein